MSQRPSSLCWAAVCHRYIEHYGQKFKQQLNNLFKRLFMQQTVCTAWTCHARLIFFSTCFRSQSCSTIQHNPVFLHSLSYAQITPCTHQYKIVTIGTQAQKSNTKKRGIFIVVLCRAPTVHAEESRFSSQSLQIRLVKTPIWKNLESFCQSVQTMLGQSNW